MDDWERLQRHELSRLRRIGMRRDSRAGKMVVVKRVESGGRGPARAARPRMGMGMMDDGGWRRGRQLNESQ